MYICLRVIVCSCTLRITELGGGYFQEGGYEFQLGIWPPETSVKKDQASSRSVYSQALVIAGESLASAAGQNSVNNISEYIPVFRATHK